MRTKQNPAVVKVLIVVVIGTVIVVALLKKGDVKASFKILGAGLGAPLRK